MAKNYLIFKEGGGRMGNQWLNMAHLLAFTLEYPHKFTLINLKFWYFAKYFSDRYSDRIYFYPETTSWVLVSVFLRFLDFFPRVIFRHGSSWIIRLLFKFNASFKSAKPIVLPPLAPPFPLDDQLVQSLSEKSVTLDGWGFRNWDLLEKHEENVRKLLVPNYFQVQKVERGMMHIRKNYSHLVGVFIRQTDYKTWKEGEFYFTVEEYIRWMNVYQENYSQTSKGTIAFIIVTDEPNVAAELKNASENYFVFHGNTLFYYLRNIIRLSTCETIMSPPSTFAALAAFVGKRTIVPLHRGNRSLEAKENLHHSFFDARNHPVFKVAVN